MDWRGAWRAGGRRGGKRKFADGDSLSSGKIDFILGLNGPARSGEHLVDFDCAFSSGFTHETLSRTTGCPAVIDRILRTNFRVAIGQVHIVGQVGI